MPAVPRRVVFNFAARCNMHCAFCYIPFDGQDGSEQTALKVIDAISRWDISNLTIGGGDPLMYPYLPSLCKHARSNLRRPAVIQLDTNSLGMTRDLLEQIACNVDVIGLPIETTVQSTATKMGRGATYQDVFTRSLRKLTDARVPIKINTVVTAANQSDLIDVGTLIAAYEIRLWSVYQFWLITPSPSMTFTGPTLSDREFREATASLPSLFPNLRIEIGAVSDRAPAYFFVTHTGRAYTITQAGNEAYRYIELGSIFDDETLHKWTQFCDPAANARRAEMRARGLRLSAQNDNGSNQG